MNNETKLVRGIARYYKKSLEVFTEFGGPSVYFHVQAIREQRHNFLSERHIEMIYATLASWGMHRMGKTETKMKEFEAFQESLTRQRHILSERRDIRMDGCSEEEYRGHIERLESVYSALQVSISDATVVAHSKVLAHLLPDLVPPIDRQYTQRFFTQDSKDFVAKSGKKYKAVKNFPVGLEKQFSLFKDYCVRIKRMFDQCDRGKFEIDPNTFNTSYPKIMDNVIMAFVKCEGPHP